MNYANKLLYIGAGLNIKPVTHFTNTREFIFIDTQPRNEFDSYLPKYSVTHYKHQFYSRLINICRDYGFELDTCYCIDEHYYKKIMSWKQRMYYFVNKLPEFINPTLLVFTNVKTEQTIHYYVSTNIKYNVSHSILRLDIEGCDGIIVSEYYPEIHLLQYMKQPVSFFGYTNTCYTLNNVKLGDHLSDNIIYFLQTHEKPGYFKDFYMVNKNGGKIVKCKDFPHFAMSVARQQYNAKL